jgi:hypothetical protein
MATAPTSHAAKTLRGSAARLPHYRPSRATVALKLEHRRSRIEAETDPMLQHTDLKTLAAAMACSQIVVARRRSRRRLPAGFDAVDVAILEWIAAESRRAGSAVVRM